MSQEVSLEVLKLFNRSLPREGFSRLRFKLMRYGVHVDKLKTKLNRMPKACDVISSDSIVVHIVQNTKTFVAHLKHYVGSVGKTQSIHAPIY